jgi:hypothetical protein
MKSHQCVAVHVLKGPIHTLQPEKSTPPTMRHNSTAFDDTPFESSPAITARHGDLVALTIRM